MKKLQLLIYVGFILINTCGPSYIENTKVPYNKLNMRIYRIIKAYQEAMERRDIKALLNLASQNYHEDSGTYASNDDYDYNGLKEVLLRRFNRIEQLRLKMQIQKIEVNSKTANVDYEYYGTVKIKVGEAFHWHSKYDQNRLTLEIEQGQWKIVSGM